MKFNARSIISIFAILVFVLFLAIYKFVILNQFIIYENLFKTVFFILYVFILYKVYGIKKQPNQIKRRKAIYYLVLLAVLFFIVLFIMGHFMGFNKNALSFSIDKFLINLIYPIVFIISIELIRYIFMNSYKYNIDMVIITLLLIVYDILCSYNIYHFYDIKEFYLLICMLIIPSIIKNCVLSYISFNFGYVVTILYRIVFELYLIVLPIIPDIGNYLNCIFLIIIPFVYYLLCNSIINRTKKEKSRNDVVINIIFIAIVLVISAVVSGIFRYRLVAVGSGSMSPSINYGDAILVERYKEETDIKYQDVIYFYNKDMNKYIVHRVVEKTDDGYVTKGDSNNTKDNYIVKYEDIKGKVVLRIPYIGYPSIKLQELVSGD